MSDLQQQVADGARPLARVGDVIEHGQDIPANVVRLADADGEEWQRVSTFPLTLRYAATGGLANIEVLSRYERWWPLMVVEVDPEPQAAEPSGPGDREPDPREVADHHLMKALGVDRLDQVMPAIQRLQGLRTAGEIDRDIVDRVADLLDVSHNDDIIGRLQHRLGEASTQPTESGPVVLSLPQVPDGAVALVGVESGERRESPGLAANGRPYWCGKDGHVLQLGAVLDAERRVTVEFAPPREPRVWPKAELPPADLFKVQVPDWSGDCMWLRAMTGFFCTCPRHKHLLMSLANLREVGEVREVIEP